MDRGQRLFHAAEAGERDRRSEVAAFLQVPEQFKAVHARHDQIRDDDVRVEGGEPFQRFLPVGGDLRFKVTIGKHGGQGARCRSSSSTIRIRPETAGCRDIFLYSNKPRLEPATQSIQHRLSSQTGNW